MQRSTQRLPQLQPTHPTGICTPHPQLASATHPQTASETYFYSRCIQPISAHDFCVQPYANVDCGRLRYDVSRAPMNAVERLAALLLPLTGCAEAIVGCEWWVHSKAKSNGTGHQMHFDTEEGTLHATGEIVHPVVSSVLYLSGASEADPTVNSPPSCMACLHATSA